MTPTGLQSQLLCQYLSGEMMPVGRKVIGRGNMSLDPMLADVAIDMVQSSNFRMLYGLEIDCCFEVKLRSLP